MENEEYIYYIDADYNEIIEVDNEEFTKINDAINEGKFFDGKIYTYDLDSKMYVALDNSTFNCWIEEFDNLIDCVKWLRGDE